MFGYRMKVFWIALIMIIDGSQSASVADPYCSMPAVTDPYMFMKICLGEYSVYRYRYKAERNQCFLLQYSRKCESSNRNHYQTEDECNNRCKKSVKEMENKEKKTGSVNIIELFKNFGKSLTDIFNKG
ncbi:Uncharacterised protein at_DN0854 [Pycnogonum litorale]